jgi:histidinol-phosphate aminotransferase
MSFDPAKVIRPEVRALRAYQLETPPGDPPRVKLDANESPFALGDTVRNELAAELAKALADVELNRYPDPEARELRRLLAQDLGLAPEQILASNGSDEGIQMLLMAVAGTRVAIAAPVPTFVMYEIGSRVLGLRFVGVPLDDRFDLDPEAFCRVLTAEKPRLVFLAWPNNPTGRLYDSPVVEEVLRTCSGRGCDALVVVDEAYMHYSGETFLPKLSRYSNLVILRTLSKIGLAGIRLGMLIGSEAVVGEVNKVRMPYNVNALSQAAARVILRHPDVVRRHASAIIQERERVVARLRELSGIRVFSSRANFFLIRTDRPGDEVFRGLCERGILVRNFSGAPYLANCLRVTVGTPEENNTFLSALGAVLSRGG